MSYTWPDGSRGHTIPYAQHQANMERQRQEQAHAQAIQNSRTQAAVNTPGWIPSTLNGGYQPTPAWGQPPVAAPPAAPGAPPAAPEPTPRKPFEWTADSGYNDEVGLAESRFKDANTDLDTAERTTKFQFGIDDPTNAFSRAAELKKLFLAKNNSTRTSLNSSGLLFSGAMLRAIDRNKRNNDQAESSLREEYQAALDRIRTARTAAERQREEDKLRAKQNSYDRQFAVYNAS